MRAKLHHTAWGQRSPMPAAMRCFGFQYTTNHLPLDWIAFPFAISRRGPWEQCAARRPTSVLQPDAINLEWLAGGLRQLLKPARRVAAGQRGKEAGGR